MKKARQVTFVRVIRGQEPPHDPDDAGMTPSERMAAVWELTLGAMAWTHADQPRLDKSIVKIKRSGR